MSEWIPVNEGLPESDGYGHYFLCCLENGIIRILGYSNILTTRCPKGFYYEKENGTTWRQDINPVIAWMPLPEPYKETDTPCENKTCEGCSYYCGLGICNLEHICLDGSEWCPKTE